MTSIKAVGGRGSSKMEQAHASQPTLAWLEGTSSTALSAGGRVFQGPHSPDLTPLDFFLWGYLKYKVD